MPPRLRKGDLQQNQLKVARKSGREVVDAFLFFNELDLLEIRLSILDDFVDYFVLVEATETFSGTPKPLHYEINKTRFSRWEHKIRHHVVRKTPSTVEEILEKLKETQSADQERKALLSVLENPNLPAHSSPWIRELYQRESISKAIPEGRDHDLCFISDVDEIWNPDFRARLKDGGVLGMRQTMYSYYLDNRTTEPWIGSFLTNTRTVRDSPVFRLKTRSKLLRNRVKDGGWHFTNLGGAEKLVEKIEAYSHQEFNTQEIKSSIAARIAKNEDFIGRKYRLFVDAHDLPGFVLANREKFEHLFRV